MLCQLAVVLAFLQNLQEELPLILRKHDIRERYIRVNNIVKLQKTVLISRSKSTAPSGLDSESSSGGLCDIRFLHQSYILSLICIKEHTGNTAISFLILVSRQSFHSGLEGTLVPGAMSGDNICDQFGFHSLSIPLSQS